MGKRKQREIGEVKRLKINKGEKTLEHQERKKFNGYYTGRIKMLVKIRERRIKRWL